MNRNSQGHLVSRETVNRFCESFISPHRAGNLEPALTKEGELFNSASIHPPSTFSTIIPIFHAHWAEIGSEHGHMCASVEFIKAN